MTEAGLQPDADADPPRRRDRRAASRETATPAAPMASRLMPSMAQTVASPAGKTDDQRGEQHAPSAVLQPIDMTVGVLQVGQRAGDHIELLAVVAEAGDQHRIGDVALDEAARRAAVTDAQQRRRITVVRRAAATVGMAAMSTLATNTIDVASTRRGHDARVGDSTVSLTGRCRGATTLGSKPSSLQAAGRSPRR